MPLTPAEQTEYAALADHIERDQQRARCRGRGGLIHFIRLMWKVIEPERPLVEGWVLEAICEHLEAVTFGDVKRLLVNVPPGSTKSLTAAVFWPAWEWGPMGMVTMRYMCASYSGNLSRRDNVRFRRLITSPEYQRLWGDVFGPSADQFSIERVSNDKTGWKLATSVGGVGTGERADRVIIDDGNNPLESESDAIMDTTRMWFTEVIPDRLNALDESAIINIQQRTNEGDISGIILELGLPYTHLMVPMEYDPTRHCATEIGWQDPRGLDDYGQPLNGHALEQATGLLAWPERFSPAALADLYKAKGPYAVSGQYQQLPTPRGGGLFQREWIQGWPPLSQDGGFPADMLNERGGIRMPALEYVVGWVDTAYTERQENDFSAMTVVGIFRAEGKGVIVPNGNGTFTRIADDYGFPKAVVLHAWQKRLTIHGPPQEIPDGISLEQWNSPRYLDQRREKWGLVEWVADTVKRYKVDYLGIETQAVGHTLEQELVRLHQDLSCVVELVPARGDKVARGYAVQGSFSSRQIYFPTYEDGSYPTWLTPLADQLFVFPKGAHDDMVDSLTGAIKHLRDTGLFERREEFDRAVEHSLQWTTNRRVSLPYQV